MEVNLDPEADSDSQFCVKWSNHHGTLISVLETLFNDEMYVDCTLAAEGQEISAHKVVLSACSPFLNKLLKKHYDKHPIILLRDVTFFELQCVIEYMYKGEVSVSHDQLSSFLKAAETLQIAGLSGVYEKNKIDHKNSVYTKETERMEDFELNDESESLSPLPKRQKVDQEEIEYLSQEEMDEVEQDDAKPDFSSYQVYVVDNETGALKEMEMENEINNAKLSESIGEIFNEEENTEYSMQDVALSDTNKIKGKLLPEKISTAFRSSRIKPRSIIQRDDYNFSCTKCGGLYKHESSFLNHLRHDCNQIHTCDACRKSFKNKRHLLDHVRDDCGRVHICPRCNKYFKQKVNLTTHMKHYCKPEKGPTAPTFNQTL